MKKITKKQSKTFVDKLCKALIEVGAKKIKDKISSFRTFELDTIVGKLEIDVVTENDYCYTMFTRFEDVDRAKGKFPCNPYSGKYNTHVGREHDFTPENAVETCMDSIKITLPKKMTFQELKVGESYKQVSHNFGDAMHDVTCISEDVLGLSRGIKYFCRKDSIKPIPSENEVREAMQEVDTPRMKEIRMNIFSVWDFELDGETPSTSFLCLRDF